MLRSYLFILVTLILISSANAQVNFANDVAPLIWENCSQCHNDNGIANSTFLNYQQVVPWASVIKSRINSTDAFQKMPPWSPNSEYREFAHQRVLTSTEIQTISDWVDNGTPAGDTANMPAPPTFGTQAVLGIPDLQLQIPTYASKATSGQDDYVCFVLPTGLNTMKRIKAIEVIPGNREIVHHVVITKDSSNFQTDTIGGDCGGIPTAEMIGGYLPGSTPIIFPNGNGVKMGVQLFPSERIILGMHYPEGSFGMTDSTKINIHFYEDTVANVREVLTGAILGQNSFCFSANAIDSLDDRFPASGGLGGDVSILGVNPHAHLLAKSYIVYAIDPFGDTIKIIDIPQWNFEWQDFYTFKNILKIPAGSHVYAKAIYDNTTNNPFNPNNPPQMVCQGDNTSDEMFLVYFQYLPYQVGDELIDLEALTTITNVRKTASARTNLELKAVPNPFDDRVELWYHLETSSDVHLSIFNVQGQLIESQVFSNQSAGEQRYEWSAENQASGLYLARLRVGNKVVTKKLIVR